jgi:hypothetical protein
MSNRDVKLRERVVECIHKISSTLDVDFFKMCKDFNLNENDQKVFLVEILGTFVFYELANGCKEISYVEEIVGVFADELKRNANDFKKRYEEMAKLNGW